jgi:phenylpropionate dioxygenase-like ring-hydroxylating dioxygenase large terminal subunit
VPSREDIDRGLRRAWFPVARSQDLDQPRPVELLGELLVAFRTEDGEAAVLSRRCAHRGADLSMGKVRGSSIACPYHGWEWRGADGACTRVPALGPDGKAPAGARIPSYPVQEKWGLVWTCLGDPMVDLPHFPEYDGLDLTWALSEEIAQDCGIAAATENFRDVAHFPFVHRESMGETPEEVPPLQVERSGYEAFTSRFYKAEGGSEELFSHDMTHHYHSIAPSFSSLVFDYHGLGKRILLNTVQPVGAGGHGCIVRFAVAIEKGFPGVTIDECLKAETTVYLEDRPIVNKLTPHEVPFGERIEFSTVADRYTAAYRMCFVEFVKDALAADEAQADSVEAGAPVAQA